MKCGPFGKVYFFFKSTVGNNTASVIFIACSVTSAAGNGQVYLSIATFSLFVFGSTIWVKAIRKPLRIITALMKPRNSISVKTCRCGSIDTKLKENLFFNLISRMVYYLAINRCAHSPIFFIFDISLWFTFLFQTKKYH